MAGVNLVHVPYKGGGPAMQDVIAGHVKIMFSLAGADHALHQIRPAARARHRRHEAQPGAARRADHRGGRRARLCGGQLVGHCRRRPACRKPIVDKLYSATQAALKSPELQAAFDREGAATVEMSSAQFADYIKTEIAKWGRVVKEGNIHAQ